MSPYFPHCIKNNKNSVLLKDKKVVLCGRFGCHYLLVTPLGSTSLKKCTEQSKGPIFSSNELNALPGRLASATPALQAISLSRGVLLSQTQEFTANLPPSRCLLVTLRLERNEKATAPHYK